MEESNMARHSASSLSTRGAAGDLGEDGGQPGARGRLEHTRLAAVMAAARSAARPRVVGVENRWKSRARQSGACESAEATRSLPKAERREAGEAALRKSAFRSRARTGRWRPYRLRMPTSNPSLRGGGHSKRVTNCSFSRSVYFPGALVRATGIATLHLPNRHPADMGTS